MGQDFVPLVEHAPGPLTPAPPQVALDHPAKKLDVIFALDGLETHHVQVAEALEAPRLVEDERHAAAHPGREVAPRLAEHHDDPTRHVLAGVIPDALDHGVGARVPDGETLPREAPEVRLAGGRAVERHVADDDVPGRLVAYEPGGKDGETAAGEALADVVVGRAFEGEGQAAGEPRPEGLAGDAVEVYTDRAVGQAVVAVAPGDLPGEHPADRALRVRNGPLEVDLFSVFEGWSAPFDQLVVQRLLEAVILGPGVPYRPSCGRLDPVEQRREVHAARLPVFDGVTHLEPVGAPDHLPEAPEAHAGHVFAHLFGDEEEVVDNVLRSAGKALPQLGVLGRYAHRAGVQVADAHHDAAGGNERRGRESEVLGPE